MKPSSHLARTGLLLTSSLAILSLAACNKIPSTTQTAAAPQTADVAQSADAASASALPLNTSAPAAPPSYAPAANALPPAPPAPVTPPPTPAASYSYVARAQAFNNGLANAPPQYAVEYQGARPWYWRAQNGAYRVAEPTPQGDRYYYFEPGADRPFLVRDPQYAYGYDNGRLVVVYDANGRPLPSAVAARQAELAGRYLARARGLYAAAQQERHQAAYAANWNARQGQLARQQAEWSRQQQRNGDWRAWRDQHPVEAGSWRQEADARRPATGQGQGPRGPDAGHPAQIAQQQRYQEAKAAADAAERARFAALTPRQQAQMVANQKAKAIAAEQAAQAAQDRAHHKHDNRPPGQPPNDTPSES